MSKQEFIDRLRAALNGRISSNLVMENVNYYEEYINTEIRKGRTEEEVLASLGDPRLIAKTIIQANGGGDAGYSASSGYSDAKGQDQYGYQDRYQDRQQERRVLHLPGWLIVILVVLVLLVLFSVIFSVLSFLAPLIIVMAGVLFLVKLFRDWLN